MLEQRPNPEKILQRAQEEERQKKHGKLKIYLGAAPGVGKTYTMLQDALAKRAQGLDVVVGIAESHGRKKIESFLKELEVLPRQLVDYRGKQLSEFDLDAALKRNPGLILVDEIAHTNVPGLRHEKRWQDIKEILDRGIDVYTTLNVQHIESVSDIASQITHTHIKETVPDSILELAETVELVDLPPEDLLKRLQEGKIYIPAQAGLATEHFFRKGNLTALRELALRVTADRVGAQTLLYRQGQGIKHIWPTKEKILVCVGPGTESVKLIRTARRISTSSQAEWIAVYVDTPRLQASKEQHNRAMRNLHLAEQLGAETRVLTGYDIVKEIMSFAREQNVTQIIIWRKIRSYWKSLFFRKLADEIVHRSGEIDVYIVNGETDESKTPKSFSLKPTLSWKFYVITLGIVAVATFVNTLLYPYVYASNLIMVYLLGSMIVALLGHLETSILASVLSILAFDFFFVPPFYTFVLSNRQYFFTLLMMLLITQVISYMALLARRQTEAARRVERHTTILHTLSRQLASARGTNKLLEIGVRYVAEIFNSEVLALLPDESNQLIIKASYRTEKIISEKERGVAQWVYDLGQIAGLGTDTLPFSDALYVPLLTSQGTIGVLRMRPILSRYLFTPEQIHLLEACANQIALALEISRMQEQTEKSELQTEKDRVQSALLRSVSHNLRTPLVAVMGAASTLVEMTGDLSPQQTKKLSKDIYLELEQLNRLINNLLQITYLEAEAVKLQKQSSSLDEIITAVVKTSLKKLGKRPVYLQMSPDLPQIPLDNTLMQEVFLNLIDNAIKFTSTETPIEISVELENNKVIISVEDQGPGIMPDEVNRLFEKFYRGRMLTTERGMGLGLAICHSIIRAHGGNIWAENREGGGAAFRFTLPL